jgi:pimeloyl-ACP methyl ester carboxylesterase
LNSPWVDTGENTLCLAGWTQRHDALRAVAPEGAVHFSYHPCRTREEVLELLAPHARRVTRAIGWSLGGWLLNQAVREGVLHLEQLVLIAPPLQFVSSEEFPHGMDPHVFTMFRDNYRADPERSAARFAHLIARGDARYRDILEHLTPPPHAVDADSWAPWLDALEAQRHADDSYDALPPTLLIHGARDGIIPLAQSEALAARIPGATLRVLPDAAHAPHLHDPRQVRAWIAEHPP